jgi:hypothetical protein
MLRARRSVFGAVVVPVVPTGPFYFRITNRCADHETPRYAEEHADRRHFWSAMNLTL